MMQHPTLSEYLAQELTPLQKVALNRITEIKKELKKKYGLYVRTAIELEFMVQDKNGKIIKDTIPIDDVVIYDEPDNGLFVKRLEADDAKTFLINRQNISSVEQFKRDGTSEYEIVLSDTTDERNRPDSKNFAAENIAGQTAFLKAHGLKRLLQTSTCLSSYAQGLAEHGLSPLFTAAPYVHAQDANESEKRKSSALHVNVSLYNKDGDNLFHEHPKLQEECANSLINIQAHAGLSMLPTAESLDRIGLNNSAPGSIKIIEGAAAYVVPGQKPSSVSIRWTDYPDDARIENRLPGADADPFVATAVTMSALLDAAKKHVQKKGDEITVNMGMPVRDTPKDIPKRFEDLVSKMRSASGMRGVIGEELYDKILEEYGSPKQQLSH